MKTKFTTTLLGLAMISLPLAGSASAASSLLFNYSNISGNNIATPAEVGVEALVNVTGNGGTKSGTLDGVGYSMSNSDWWQSNFLANVGHPYTAVLEQNVTVSFSGLSAWLAAEGATSYEVTVFYGGDSNQANYFAAGDVTVAGSSETFTSTVISGNFWGADGATRTMSADSFTITDTTNDYKAGISSVQISAVTAVPEPSSAALLGLGGLTLILRRSKN